MIERVWRYEALRVHLLSHIGVVVASAVVLVAGQPATAQYTSDFEAPLYLGSAGGTIITGQDAFYIPVLNSQDGLVYTYAGNALGLPANPGGGEQFAGVTGGDIGLPVPFARAQRDVVYGGGTGVWTVSFDIAATYIGNLPSAQNLGSFSTQLFGTQATFIALARWTDPVTAANWNADYVWFNAGGGQVLEVVADPGFQNLLVDHWYRWSTTFNLDTNQIVQISITDLTTGVTATHSPVARYLVGGAGGGAAPPSGFRLFAGSSTAAGNTLAFDNVDIDLASGTPSGACCFVDETCGFLTEADCGAAGGTYQGDWTGCTETGCITIPEECVNAAGSCSEPHPTPGCNIELCCALVCSVDLFCCNQEWDQNCVDLAATLPECDVPPDPPSAEVIYGLNFTGDNFFTTTSDDFVGNFTVVGGAGYLSFAMDTDVAGTTLYAVLFDGLNTYGTIDLATGAFTPSGVIVGPAITANVSGLSIDPTSGSWYLCGLDGDPLVATLYVGDITTGIFAPVGPIGFPLNIDLAIDSQGNAFGHDIGTDELISINLGTGAGTAIGPTGQAGNFAQGMDFDYTTDTLYATLYTDTGSFGFFDLVTGAFLVLQNTSVATNEMEMVVVEAADCPWDCQPEPDGLVSTPDLLALLGQWFGPGSCEFSGDGFVSTPDLLKMLGAWGPCP